MGRRSSLSGLLLPIDETSATGAPRSQQKSDLVHAHAISDVTSLTALLDPSVRVVAGVGNNVSDDTVPIQNAIAATPVGGTCLLPPGRYRTTAPIVVPPNKTFRGTHSPRIVYASGSPTNPCAIIPASTFSGAAVVRVVDKTTGGYATDSVQTHIENIAIEGAAAPSGVKGFQIYGRVRETRLRDCAVYAINSDSYEMTGYSPYTGDAASPLSLRFEGCVAANGTGAGFVIGGCSDTTLVDCLSEGSGYVGFYIGNMPNGMLIGCRSEWSGNNGFLITGSWGTAAGTGGFQMTGCSTDRNNFNGVYIDATGSSSIVINGLNARRDGRNNGNGGNSYSAFAVNGATIPIIVDGLLVYPGANDDGSGTLSPERGVTSTSATAVVIGSGYIHAATTAVVDGGSNGAFVVPPIVGRATGTTSAPTRVAPSNAVPAHDASLITSGTVAAARLPGGVAGGVPILDSAADVAIANLPYAGDGVSSALLIPLANDSRLSNARTPTTHGHAASDITSGVLATARVPLVASPPITIAYTATWTPVASSGNNQKMSATGNVTLVAPTSPSDGQMLMLSILGSGVAITVGVPTTIQRTGTLPTTATNTVSIANGKVGFFGLRYSALSGNWTWLSLAVEV